MKWIKPLLGAMVLCALAFLIIAPVMSSTAAAMSMAATIAGVPLVAWYVETAPAHSRLRRVQLMIAAGLGIATLAACNPTPKIEPTQPVPIEPCKPGNPECTWPDGQPK
jgi:hypothetical protein